MSSINKQVDYCSVKNDSSTEELREESSWKFWKKRRLVVGLLVFFGYCNIYALRVNLSVAIVAMTENKTVVLDDGEVIYVQEFDWNSKQQGFVLSSFFYGYVLTQFLGGWLATKYGGCRIFGLGIAVTAALTIITPLAAKQNFYLLLAVRVVEGFFEGFNGPSTFSIWSYWSPPLERSRWVAISFSGIYVGSFIAMPTCAYLEEVFGWESIFYVFGVVGLLWYLCWLMIVSEKPSQDRYISKAELKYITTLLENENIIENTSPPWASIFKSPAVWAIFVAHFSENWGFYTLLIQLPKFIKDIFKFDLGKTGLMSAVPFIAMSITVRISGYLGDFLQVKKIFTTVQVRKICTCGAFLLQTIFLLLAIYLVSPVGTPICLTIALGCGAFTWAGFGVNYLDIAPQYASILVGVGNTLATLPGVLSPILSGYVVTTPNEDEWRIVFYIASAIYLIGALIYFCLASGKIQKWATKTQDSSLERL